MSGKIVDDISLKRVLILDDEIKLQDIMARLVRSFDLDVFTTDDGRDAIQEHSNRRFDVMFVDLDMPKMGGAQFIMEVREINGGHRPFVVVMTGLKDVTLGGLDVDGIILKPFGVREVEKALRIA